MTSPAEPRGAVARFAPLIAVIGLVVAFVVTRLPHLDADIPEWALTQYSPIDEFGYTVPAFNLHHYGTWVHQAAPWAPVEGLPMNVLENIGAALTMRLIGYDYWGLRASSLAFALIAFLSIVAVVRRQALDARRFDDISPRLGVAVVVGAAILLLVDYSSILSARVIEPTVTRLAVTALLLFLVSRRTFLREDQGLARTAVFGIAVGAAVAFVYIYNLFLLPAAFATVAWWAYRSGRWRATIRHGAAFLAGVVVAWSVYFVLIKVVYDQSPLEWYRVWLGSFANSTRASGFSIQNMLTVLDGNVFRLDPAFLGLFLASIPVFVWGLVRRPDPSGVFIGAGLVFLIAQTAVVADYPARKGLMLIAFAVPIAASGILLFGPFRAWLVQRRRRVVIAAAWLAVVVGVTILGSSIRSVPHGALLVRIVAAATVIGVVAIVVVALSRPGRIRVAGLAALGLAVLTPLLYADAAFLYRHPTFSYRDAMIEVRPVVDGQQTAGGWSFGMQLYNTSRAVVNGYYYGMTRLEYERNVVRMFTDGLASSMFDYVDAKTRTHWESLGFRLVTTYDIVLPRGQRLGRYVFGSGA